jgi:polyisoprenoid-binding protein YceI
MNATESQIFRSRIVAVAAGAAALLLATPAAAQALRYEPQPTGSKVRIEGTSTLHNWTVEGPVINGFIEADIGFPESALTDSKAAKPNVQVLIPVEALKSFDELMDEVMQEHMDMAKYPNIEYHLGELKPESAAGAAGPLKFVALGTLTVSGTAQPSTMTVTIERIDSTRIKIAGSTPLKMTDFGVEPPAPRILGMPTIRTGDDIKVSFEWLLVRKAAPAAKP